MIRRDIILSNSSLQTIVIPQNTKNILEGSETLFFETQKKIAEPNKAMTEYKSEAKARATKTARLRALRQGQEKRDRAAASLAPKPAMNKRASRAAAWKPVAHLPLASKER